MTSTIWSDEPVVRDAAVASGPAAERQLWEQSVYPLGNGRLGCTAFGGPGREQIQFNQDSLWVGNEDNTGGYQPFGDVTVELGRAGEKGDLRTGATRAKAFSDYRRELDIERAVQTITYTAGGVNYRREFFVSYPAQVMVLRFTADRPGAYSGRVSLDNVHDIPTTAEAETLVMRGDTGCLWYWRKILAEPNRLLADRDYASPRNIDLDFEARVRLLHEGGQCAVAGDALVFENCDSLTVLLAADTSYLADRSRGWRGEHPHAKVTGLIDVASRRPYDELLQEHVADFRAVSNRMSLDLGSAPEALATCSTPARLRAYRERVAAGEAPVDTALEALFYQYGRYLMISSSRPGHGALPANLQGIWLMNRHPAWRCDFHTDINLQMNYWFTSASNLADCFTPLAHWVDSIRAVRQEETRKVLGAERGWLMRSENGIFGGSTWHFQKGDSAWLCQNLWDHYSFTQDKAYLLRYAYPVMKEISEFWVDHLKALPDGTLVAPEGRSPEHGPVGVDGVTYDQALCWDLFTNTIEASEVLGVDDAFRAELIAKRDRLLGPQVGRWGQLQEWMEDLDDPEDDHRHINHLISVYPGCQVHPATTPELAAAAKVSLVARRDRGEGHPAWSRVWKACLFARLADGESAHDELAITLANHVYDNLWTVHPPFQIDANFGYDAAVNEMLVQSRVQGAGVRDQASGGVAEAGYEVELLPALPQAWPEGSVRGMRVRGGYELDIAWQDGALTQATLRGVSCGPEEIVVRYGAGSATVALAAGEARELLAGDF